MREMLGRTPDWYPLESKVREAVDPDFRLPQVWLHGNDGINAYQGAFWNNTLNFQIQSGNDVVGEAHILPKDYAKEAMFMAISIQKDKAVNRKGMGMAAYVLAIEHTHEQGYTFRTDEQLSLSAKRIWERFIDLGIAEVYSPFQPVSSGIPSGAPRYVGDVRIKPL